jgi:hypothetical protein
LFSFFLLVGLDHESLPTNEKKGKQRLCEDGSAFPFQPTPTWKRKRRSARRMKSLVWQIFPLPNVGLLAPGKVICHYEKDSWRQRSKKKNETVDNFPKDRLEVVR